MQVQALTPRMRAILDALAELHAQRRYPATPNEIGYALGFMDGGRRHGHGANGPYGWTGHMGPANRVIFSLIALEKRGLIAWVDRRDDLSGRAVALRRDGKVIY